MMLAAAVGAAATAGLPCDGAVVAVNSNTAISVCSESIMRVVHKAAGGNYSDRESLVVKANWTTPQYKKTDDGSSVTVTTSKVKAVGDKQTGAVTFYDAAGKVVLQETGHSVTPVKDLSTNAYAVSQTWASPDGEALYGGGEFQNGIVNWKSAPVQMVQFNTEAAVPFFVSSLGHGVLWDQYSWTYLNKPDESQLLSFSMQPLPAPPVQPLADGADVSMQRCLDAFQQHWARSADGRFYLDQEPSGVVSLDCNKCTVGKKVHVWHASNASLPAEEWVLNDTDGSLSAKSTGYCMASDGKMHSCNSTEPTQRWAFDAETGRLTSGGQCLGADVGPQNSANVTATEDGDHYLYFLGCNHSFGCGMGKVVDLTVQDLETGEIVLVQRRTGRSRSGDSGSGSVQDWESLSNLPDSITGRAVGLRAGRKYAVTLVSKGFTDPKVYIAPPSKTTSLSSEVARQVDYYFMMGGSVDGTIARYREATGVAYLYSKWVYGFWQCKEHYKTQAGLLAAAQGFRNRSIPVDSIVQDWHYWGDLGWGPQWDPKEYPDPAGMVKQLNEWNFHFMVSVWSKFDKQTSFYKTMTADNQMIPGTVYYDPYNAAAREQFFQFSKKAHFDIGVDSLWLDATEPEGLPNKDNYVKLGTGNEYMNPYSLMTTKAIADGLRRDFADAQGRRVFSLTRSAFLGQQRTGAALWSGDISGEWDSLRRQISAAVNYQLSGIPYWSEDIGGFFRPSNQYDSEDYHQLLTRWFHYGVFTPIFRVHGGGSNTELWNYGEAEKWINDSAVNLRYRLLPYIYSGFSRVEREGYTMQRGLVFDFASDAAVHNIADQYMFGPAFMVSPIYTPGLNASRSVYLPTVTGGWVCFYHGTRVAGGRVTATVGIEEMPVFVRAGSIVPLGPYMQHTGQSADPTEVRVYPGASGSFTLYDDDGVSSTQAAGHAFATVELSWDDSSRTLTIGAREGSYPGMAASRTFNVVVVSGTHGTGVAPTAAPDRVVRYSGEEVVVKV